MRTSAETLQLDGVEALIDASRQLGVPAEPVWDEPGLVEMEINGRRLRVEVHGATLLDGPRARNLTRRSTRPRSTALVVGDKILESARSHLGTSNWSWLDRRGHLHLTAPGALIDSVIEPDPRAGPPRRPDVALAAHGGQELAVLLLLSPDDPPGVRDVARSTGLAPSTVSRARTQLISKGFVRSDGRPVNPDLFWALAEHWAPEWTAIDRPLSPSDPRLAELGANLDDLDRAGFAVSGTRGALGWGAPVVASTDTAPSIYVPDRATRDQVLAEWGKAVASTPRGWVAIAPVHGVTDHRFLRPGETWPIAHPVVVALDLATDRARGRQILDEWDPEDPPRVW